MNKASKLQFISLVGLVSTGVAALINLGVFTLSAFWLEPADLVTLRVVLNTALIAGVLLCLGWDSACVRLPANDMNQLDALGFWGLSLGGVACLGVGHTLPAAGGLYLQGLAIGGLFAYPILHFNIRRAQGHYLGYFLGLNIADKIIRGCIIVAAIVVWSSHMIAAIFIGLLGWNFVLKSAYSPKFQGNLHLVYSFVQGPNRYKNPMFILSSFFMFFLTRALFFATPPAQTQILVSIDLAMMVGAFLLVPVQSALKISEAEQYRTGEAIFSTTSEQTLLKLMGIEGLVVLAACALIVFYDQVVMPGQLNHSIALAVLAGFIVVSTMPNVVQIAIHADDPVWACELATFLCLAGAGYTAAWLGVISSVSAFGVAGLLYLVFSGRLARRCGLKSFFYHRIMRTALFLVTQVALVYLLAL